MFPFLQLNRFPTLDRLWSNLAETRRVRRRFEHEGLNYSCFYGIRDESRLARALVSLKLREKIVSNLIKKKLSGLPDQKNGVFR